LSKVNFTDEYGYSKDYVIAIISSVTKINKKAIVLNVCSFYNTNDDIKKLKALSNNWLKEIEAQQTSFSFLSDFDFGYYKEIILAILTLSFIWASFFATKKIRRTIKAREKTIEPIKDEGNDFIDFEELLVDNTVSVEDEIQKPPLDDTLIDDTAPLNHSTINPEWHKASRTIRLFNFIIDMLLSYVVLSYGFGYALGYYGFGNYVIEHPYLFNIIILFVPYFLMEYFFGKTIGKFITRTHVVNSSGGKPTIWQILGRTTARFIPFESFTFLSKEKRGLHDTISETYVIQD